MIYPIYALLGIIQVRAGGFQEHTSQRYNLLNIQAKICILLPAIMIVWMINGIHRITPNIGYSVLTYQR